MPAIPDLPDCANDAVLDERGVLILNHDDGFAWLPGTHVITLRGDWTITQLRELADMMERSR